MKYFIYQFKFTIFSVKIQMKASSRKGTILIGYQNIFSSVKHDENVKEITGL